jgi:hypothetical protein
LVSGRSAAEAGISGANQASNVATCHALPRRAESPRKTADNACKVGGPLQMQAYFHLYFLALNRRLLAKGRNEANEERARQYFDEGLPIDLADDLEAIEQELDTTDIWQAGN